MGFSRLMLSVKNNIFSFLLLNINKRIQLTLIAKHRGNLAIYNLSISNLYLLNIIINLVYHHSESTWGELWCLFDWIKAQQIKVSQISLITNPIVVCKFPSIIAPPKTNGEVFLVQLNCEWLFNKPIQIRLIKLDVEYPYGCNSYSNHKKYIFTACNKLSNEHRPFLKVIELAPYVRSRHFRFNG